MQINASNMPDTTYVMTNVFFIALHFRVLLRQK